jgi:glucose/arabinose dehydrogenase
MHSKLSFRILQALALAAVSAACSAEVDLDEIDLPEGFTIAVYADGVDNPRQLALGDRGTVFAGSREAGKVHAMVDTDGDHRIDQVYLIDEDLDMPSGIEFRAGALWVGAVNRILRYDGIESRLDDPPEPVVVSDAFPDDAHHGWKYLRFGPDGMLYVPVGAPCNVCDEAGYANIRRISVDGEVDEVYASGVRNSVGLAFHPDTDDLWFTDNGRDMLGDDIPADELNHAPRAGMHFGYPYCHQGDIADPEFGDGSPCGRYEPPAAKFGAHVAALGLAFYTGEMFPDAWRGRLFVAQHGSWNRSSKVGYRVVAVELDASGSVAGQEVFASGWLQGESVSGRPNDVLQLPDGSLLISDDEADRVYRVTYSGSSN